VKEIDALAARRTALDLELEVLKQERERVRAMIDDKRRLPVLPNLHIAAPCRASWDAMTGDRRVRACTHCKQSVFNLSAMSRADAEELIRSKHGNLCAQYYRRADGTILLADCEVGVARRRMHKWFAVGAAVVIASSVAIATRPTPPRRTAAAVRVPLVESFYPAGPTLAHEDAPPPDDTHVVRGMVKIPYEHLHDLDNRLGQGK
jgi:hypothetical protein